MSQVRLSDTATIIILILMLILVATLVRGYTIPDANNITITLNQDYTIPDSNNITITLGDAEEVVCSITTDTTITSDRNCTDGFNVSNNANVVFDNADLISNKVMIFDGSRLEFNNGARLN